MLFGILSLLAWASGDVMNRFIMSNKKVDTKKFVLISYFFLTLSLIPFTIYFRDFITMEIFSLFYVFILVVVVLISVCASLFKNLGFKHLEIDTVEPLLASQLIFSIILGFLFFENERDLVDGIIGIIIFLTLLFLSFNVQNKKLSLNLNRYHWFIILSAFLTASWAVLVTYLLEVYHPIILSFIRCALITLVLFLFIRVSFQDVKSNYKNYSILVIFDAASTIFLFYSLEAVGLVTTMIILSLQPLLAEWFSVLFLKEKARFKNVLATLIVITCMIISAYF